jgi:hypothetical protein
LVFLFTYSCNRPVVNEGNAIFPALKKGDGFLMSYDLEEINRRDIILIIYPEDKSRCFVLRIVGLPDESIIIRKGKVFIKKNC